MPNSDYCAKGGRYPEQRHIRIDNAPGTLGPQTNLRQHGPNRGERHAGFVELLILIALMIISVPCDAMQPLRIGALQIEDVVPFYLAEQEGAFQREGVNVVLVPFLSALERDSALTAGAIDGAIDDPVGAILLDQGRNILRITSLGLGETPKEGIFAILVGPKSPINSATQLKNTPIAVSTATIIEYVTDRLLATQGFADEEIRKIDVKKMPIRMQMLLSGSVQAATLPEPLATIAVANGARVLLSDDQAEESISQTVIVFRTTVLKERKDAVAAFFRAYRSAVLSINNDPETYRELFLRIGRIPPELAARYPIPTYPSPRPFARELYEPVMNWLVKHGLAPNIAYEDMVDSTFLNNQTR